MSTPPEVYIKRKAASLMGDCIYNCTSSGYLQKKRDDFSSLVFGAEDEARTRDPNLGKVVLYQLSYFRIVPLFSFGIAKVDIFLLPPNLFAAFFEKMCNFLQKWPKMAILGSKIRLKIPIFCCEDTEKPSNLNEKNHQARRFCVKII